MTTPLARLPSSSQSVISRVSTALRENALVLPTAFLTLLWLQLFLSLTPSWNLGTYYDYGWFVPFTAGWLFWRRVQRLKPESPAGFHSSKASAADGWIFALLAGVCVLVFFVRVVDRYDPYWRLPRLFHAAMVCCVHHLMLARFMGWRRSWAFVWITVLCLTAVPMPGNWEMALIQEATRKLMAVSSPACHLIGLPVELSGSALSLNGEILQIDEGCSGIRSFQSLLMVAVFAGEFFSTRWLMRVGLIALGIAYAFLFNAVRVLFLSHVFFRSGEDAFHAWHDAAGMATFSLSALALFGSARLLKPKRSSLAPQRTRTAAAGGA